MIRTVLFVNLIFFSGCVVIVNDPDKTGSFKVDINNVVNTKSSSNTQVPSGEVVTPKPTVVEREVVRSCTVPPLPGILSIPELPSRLEAVLTSPLEVEDYLLDHIERLLEFIETRNRKIEMFYADVLEECQ